MKSAFNIVKDFEDAVGEYTGAPFVVAVNSCTNALFLCLMWLKSEGNLPSYISIPKRTYVSVPMQILLAGAKVSFNHSDWTGAYQLGNTRIWDAARRFTSGMYTKEHKDQRSYLCTSHHWNKILGVQQGGCILHADEEADAWLRRARFDGRTEGVHPAQDTFDHVGWHMYMSPEVAAEGIVRLMHLPKHNSDLPMDNYPDLSTKSLFYK